MGRIWDKAPSWLANIEVDVPLVAGFASFLAVVDFLFWGGAVSSIARHGNAAAVFPLGQKRPYEKFASLRLIHR